MSRPGDDELLSALRGTLERADPVPSEVTEFARAALGWRRIDADLAELFEDSALEPEAAGIRSAGGERRLTFRAAELSLDVEVRRDEKRLTLLGQLAPPPASATVEAQAGSGEILGSIEADALGRFRLTLVHADRIRLRVLREGAAPVETSWLPL